MKNVIYHKHINCIGGIETFLYYLVKKYKDRDITIYYETGSKDQIDRLQQYVRVRKYKGERIKCDRAFFNYRLDIIDNIEAKEYIQIAHGKYGELNLPFNTHPKITKYLGVSKEVCKDFKEGTGLDIELAYNLVEIDKPKKVLNLISATRLTIEKGKNRMIKLAKLLDEAKIPYLWTVFTNDINVIDNPNIVYMKPRLDIINYIANADYLVQLSDSEAYCYSVVEALSVGTPVIVTDLSVYKELGLNNDNSIRLDLDFKDIPIDRLLKEYNFTYKPKKDSWDDLLVPSKSTYDPKKDKEEVIESLPKKISFGIVKKGG